MESKVNSTQCGKKYTCLFIYLRCIHVDDLECATVCAELSDLSV